MYFYVDRPGPLHSAHPVTKTMALLGMFFASLMIEHPGWACVPLAVAVAGVLISGAWRNSGKLAALLALITVLSIYIWTFVYIGDAGDVYISLGKWYIPRRSFMFGFGMGLRLSVMLMAGLVFLAATRVEDFTGGLHRAGLPYGLCFGLGLSFRLLPTFLEVVGTVREAQKSRGLDLDTGGLISKARKHLPLLVPVFISSIRHSDDMALALESRGFGRSNPRTYLRNYEFGFRDIILLLVVAALLAFLLWLRMHNVGRV